MTTMAQTPLITFQVKPLRYGSAPTAPAPPRNTRLILPADRQSQCVDSFHASWPALGANRGKEVRCPRLSLNVQHQGPSGKTPSPMAMLAFQRAFQKMKSASNNNTSSPKKIEKKTTTTPEKPLKKKTSSVKKTTAPSLAVPTVAATPAAAPALQLRLQAAASKTTMKKSSPSKQLKPNTVSALERLDALAPTTSPTEQDARKAARRRSRNSPLLGTRNRNATFAKTASAVKLAGLGAKTTSTAKLAGLGSKGALLMGMASGGMPRSPSATLLNNQMRRVRSSGSRGNLSSMLY